MAGSTAPGDIRHKGRKATSRHRRQQLVRANTTFPVRLATSYQAITFECDFVVADKKVWRLYDRLGLTG